MSARTVVVVIHDAASATLDACKRLRDDVQRVAPLPVTLLAVPNYHGGVAGTAAQHLFEQWLTERINAGDEAALHGYTHRDEGTPHSALDRWKRQWYTAGEGEFAALTQTEAAARLQAGMQWFGTHRWPLHGFVAPAWLASDGTWAALSALNFEYSCTLTQLVRLTDDMQAPARATQRSQSIVYSTRSAWRRVVSLGWNAAVARIEQGNALLRFELHPGDALHEPVRRSWMRLLERALTDRTPQTLAQAARVLPV